MRTLRVLTAVLVIAVAAVAAWNYVEVQRPMDRVLAADPRNAGLSVRTHFRWYIDPSTLVYDLRSWEGEKAPIDMFRVLLQYAEAQQDSSVDRVILSYRSQPKFQLEGSYFRTLGEEYAFQNPMYTARTFPEHVFRLDGRPAFGQWTGGMLGVLKEQMEDFSTFHEQWYLVDAGAGSVGQP